VRSATKEQVKSLGAKFVDTGVTTASVPGTCSKNHPGWS
jgi:hypothetical protein